MKYFGAYIVAALLAFTFASSQDAWANAAKQEGGIEVTVRRVPGNNPALWRTASSDGHGGYTVDLPAAGRYTISYANGPKKGQLMQRVSAQKAGSTKFVASE